MMSEGGDFVEKIGRRPSVHGWKSAFVQEKSACEERLNMPTLASVHEVSRMSSPFSFHSYKLAELTEYDKSRPS